MCTRVHASACRRFGVDASHYFPFYYYIYIYIVIIENFTSPLALPGEASVQPQIGSISLVVIRILRVYYSPNNNSLWLTRYGVPSYSPNVSIVRSTIEISPSGDYVA